MVQFGKIAGAFRGFGNFSLKEPRPAASIKTADKILGGGNGYCETTRQGHVVYPKSIPRAFEVVDGLLPMQEVFLPQRDVCDFLDRCDIQFAYVSAFRVVIVGNQSTESLLRRRDVAFTRASLQVGT